MASCAKMDSDAQKPWRVLVTSASSKAPLIEAVRRACEAILPAYTLIAADADARCPAAVVADEFLLMPTLETLDDDGLQRFFQANGIRAVIPTRDGELPRFARIASALTETAFMLSRAEAIARCSDKLTFATVLENAGLPAIPTALQPDDFGEDNLVVKERHGAGEQDLALNVNTAKALNHAQALQQPIFQPYIKGKEFSADCYVREDGRCHGVLLRWRERVHHGEAVISTTFQNAALEGLVAQAAERLGLYGHAIFQGILDAGGKPHLIECNARFGGASTLAIAAGLESFRWFLLEAQGKDLREHPYRPNPTPLRLTRLPSDRITPQ